jgi:hypothetical protein
LDDYKLFLNKTSKQTRHHLNNNVMWNTCRVDLYYVAYVTVDTSRGFLR